MTTIIAATKDDSAYPVVHMVSFHETERELDVLFVKAIEWNNPSPKLIMSDGAKNYATRIQKFFPNAEHKLCIWHVYRAWANQLKKIHKSNWSKEFGRLVSIQRELNKVKLIERLNTYLENSDPAFKTYFEVYIIEIDKWAAFARKYKYYNVNMFLESFHRLLKREYLQSKSKKHCVNLAPSISYRGGARLKVSGRRTTGNSRR